MTPARTKTPLQPETGRIGTVANPAMVAPMGKPQNMMVIMVPRRRSRGIFRGQRDGIGHHSAETQAREESQDREAGA